MHVVILLFIATLFASSPCRANENVNAEFIPFVDGHAICTTTNVDESLIWKYTLIKGAKRSIEMSAGVANGQVFQEVLDIFAHQLETNPVITIHLMVSEAPFMIKEHNRAYLEQLATTYPGRFHYLCMEVTGPITQEGWIYTTENHIKLIVADEKYFMLGGTNLLDNLHRSNPDDATSPTGMAESFLPRAASDMDIVAKGPMAEKLRREFFILFDLYKTKAPLWHDAGPHVPEIDAYFPVAEVEQGSISAFDDNPAVVHNVKAYTVLSGPRMQLHQIGNTYQTLIDHADSSVQLAHMYFFPTPRVYEAIVRAGQRGIEMTLITNTLNIRLPPSNSTIALYCHLSRSNYLPFLMGHWYNPFEWIQARYDTPVNSSIYEFDQEYVLYHKKVMTVDHRYSVVGSYNLGSKSENSDYEIAIFIDSPIITNQVEQILENDKLLSNKVQMIEALDWYFNPFHRLVSWFESTFFDGLILDTTHQGANTRP